MSGEKAIGYISRIIRSRYVLLNCRFILGAIFILAAAAKLPKQAQFINVVTGMGLLPEELARAYGLVLPWLELAVGICLVTGLFSRITAGLSILMIISFIVANGTGVYVHKQTHCPCFGGGLVLIKTSDALVLDIIMVAMALPVLLYGGGFLRLGSLVKGRLERFV